MKEIPNIKNSLKNVEPLTHKRFKEDNDSDYIPVLGKKMNEERNNN